MCQEARREFTSQAHKTDLADQELIGSLSDRFRPALHRYFRRRKLPARDIEDVIQEVFVRLSCRRGLAGMENISGYLFETAASVAIDYQRRANARFNHAHEPYDDQMHTVADLGTDLVLEGKEALRLLWAGYWNCRSAHATASFWRGSNTCATPR